MTAFTEIITSDRSTDTRGESQRTRVWRSITGGYTIDQVDSDPGSYDLPLRGSTYQGLTLDRYTFAQDGASIVATGYYSASGRFRLNKATPPIAPGDTPRWNFDPVTATVDVPSAIRQRITWEDASVGSVVDVWIPKSGKVQIKQYRWSIVVSIPLADRDNAAAAIATQTNRIHKLGDKWYRFEGSSLTWESTAYRTEYRWLYDPGVTDASASSAGVVVPSGLASTVDGLTYSVPPYHTVYLIPASDNIVAPTFATVLNGTVDASGYLSLPGLVL